MADTITREQLLADALALAANRLDVTVLDFIDGSQQFYERKEWAEEARAALSAPPAPAQQAEPSPAPDAAKGWCTYCGGSGDVHSITGEWRGTCTECPAAATHAFQNFHRLLCERFGYTHDKVDWQRDQLSLIEHIAAKVAAPDAAPPAPVEAVAQQNVWEALSEVPCNCGMRRRENGNHVSSCHLFDVSAALEEVFKASTTPQEARCQHCVDRQDGFYGSLAPDCPVHDRNGDVLTEAEIDACSRVAHDACNADGQARWSVKFARAIESATLAKVKPS